MLSWMFLVSALRLRAFISSSREVGFESLTTSNAMKRSTGVRRSQKKSDQYVADLSVSSEKYGLAAAQLAPEMGS